MQLDEGSVACECLLCEEGAARAAVAACGRCGAFVCRGHSLRLTYPARRIPIGLMSREGVRAGRIEVVCKPCRVIEVDALEARKKL